MTCPFIRLQNQSSFLAGPPEESFDEKYNKRLEFPLSFVPAVLLSVAFSALLIVLLISVMGGQGSGNSNQQGTGKDSKDTDSTQSRNYRWTLRFKFESGNDYVEQLKVMGAELLFQISDSKKCIIIPDLNKPMDQKQATDDDLKRLAKKFMLNDGREQSVKAVTKHLSLENVSTKTFWAFFPKELEKELAKKETDYQNKRAQDIEQTIFSVKVKDAKYEITVIEQKLKK